MQNLYNQLFNFIYLTGSRILNHATKKAVLITRIMWIIITTLTRRKREVPKRCWPKRSSTRSTWGLFSTGAPSPGMSYSVRWSTKSYFSIYSSSLSPHFSHKVQSSFRKTLKKCELLGVKKEEEEEEANIWDVIDPFFSLSNIMSTLRDENFGEKCRITCYFPFQNSDE